MPYCDVVFPRVVSSGYLKLPFTSDPGLNTISKRVHTVGSVRADTYIVVRQTLYGSQAHTPDLPINTATTLDGVQSTQRVGLCSTAAAAMLAGAGVESICRYYVTDCHLAHEEPTHQKHCPESRVASLALLCIGTSSVVWGKPRGRLWPGPRGMYGKNMHNVHARRQHWPCTHCSNNAQLFFWCTSPA